MTTTFLLNQDYKEFIENLKNNVKKARTNAFLKVNSELITLYYTIGKEICIKQQETNWGDNLIGQIEKDLKKEFPEIKGFSRRNLIYMRNFYYFFKQKSIVQQLVAQIPWGHIIKILTKIKDINEAIFYVKETINNNWSRVILEHQIESKLYQRQGKILSNFSETINKNEITLIKNSFKENYILDFLNISKEIKEKELESELINNIIYFLMELGKGFAFVGKQYKIVVGGDEFFIDLLFYNYILKRFIVVEIKTKDFKPEHLGQIGFYISVIDKDIKTSTDKETIGLLICKSKNKTVVEYALRNHKKPLGVAEYKLPDNLSKYLPTSEDLKRIL